MSDPTNRTPTSPRPRFLSEADCQDIARRLARYAEGGGTTAVALISRWTGNVRWARNRVTASGENRDNHVRVYRSINGAYNYQSTDLNEVSDAALVAAARRAERIALLHPETVDADAVSRPDSPLRPVDEPVTMPQLFSEATYQLDAGQRAEAARHLMASAAAAGMFSAGYLQVSATSMAYITSWGYAKYEQCTWAQYSVTVRDPKGAGSGWAGVDWPEWNRIKGDELSSLALEKCLTSRNPVAVEPGRYTTILEPQAVHDFVGGLIHTVEGFSNGELGRHENESAGDGPFNRSQGEKIDPPYPAGMGSKPGVARLGEKVIDERLSLSADPMDPDLGFLPYLNWMWWQGADTPVFHPITWIERGVLKNLNYIRDYAIHELGQRTGLPNPGAFRMSVIGPTASVEEMIETTKRGLLVTRFDQVLGPYTGAVVCRGYTRDGLWLIENGKISKPVKNMQFVESITSALNNVEQVGVPQRVFHPCQGGGLFWKHANPQPAIVPPLKVRDFSFVSLSDAI